MMTLTADITTLVRRDALRVLDLPLDALDRVSWLNAEGDDRAGPDDLVEGGGLDADPHAVHVAFHWPLATFTAARLGYRFMFSGARR
jgi:hypothetical protein